MIRRTPSKYYLHSDKRIRFGEFSAEGCTTLHVLTILIDPRIQRVHPTYEIEEFPRTGGFCTVCFTPAEIKTLVGTFADRFLHSGMKSISSGGT